MQNEETTLVDKGQDWHISTKYLTFENLRLENEVFSQNSLSHHKGKIEKMFSPKN